MNYADQRTEQEVGTFSKVGPNMDQLKSVRIGETKEGCLMIWNEIRSSLVSMTEIETSISDERRDTRLKSSIIREFLVSKK